MPRRASVAAVALAVLLASCEQPRELGMERRAAEAVLKAELETMRDSLKQFVGDRGACPATLGELVRAGYLPSLPVDPITRRAETWVVIVGRPEDGERCVGGVADVRSGSDRRGLDGTAYASW